MPDYKTQNGTLVLINNKLNKQLNQQNNDKLIHKSRIEMKGSYLMRNNILLENSHSLSNGAEFINLINNIKLQPNYKVASLDIVNSTQMNRLKKQ